MREHLDRDGRENERNAERDGREAARRPSGASGASDSALGSTRCDDAHVRFVDLLPFHASGALADDERRAVAAHLSVCADCREELALWREAGGIVVESAEARPAPSAAPLLGALAEIRGAVPASRPAGAEHAPERLSRIRARRQASRQPERFGGERASEGRLPLAVRDSLAFAYQLLRSQAPLVRRDLWPTSALAMGLGLVVAFLVPIADQAGTVVSALTPLIAAASIALVSDPGNDSALELTLATPTSPRQVLLARLALVFGYDFVLALAATIALVATVPPSLLGGIALGWLGPMAFLSALALMLSPWLGTGSAVGVSFSLWLSRWIGPDVLGTGFLTDGLAAVARGYEATWSNTPLLLGLACALLAVAVWRAGRQEPAMWGLGA